MLVWSLTIFLGSRLLSYLKGIGPKTRFDYLGTTLKVKTGVFMFSRITKNKYSMKNETIQRELKKLVPLLGLVLTACIFSEAISKSTPTTLPDSVMITSTVDITSPITVTISEPSSINTPTKVLMNTLTPTPQVQPLVMITPSPITRSPSPKKIADSEIYEVWWSLDSKTLFYRVPGEGKFAYNLEDNSIQKLSNAEVSQQTPTPDILAQLPPYYLTPHISPSGNKAIYINQADAPPISTIDPAVEGGEAPLESHQLDLWLWEDNTSRLLGNPLQCRFDESFWTPDEKKVVLVEASIPMVSCPIEAQAWLIDLDNDTYTPLFPPSDFFNLRVYGFSPMSAQLLVGFSSYETGANLHFFDAKTLNLTPIDAPVDNVIQWVDENNILVGYRGNLTHAPYPVGILNLHTLEFTELLPRFNGKYVKNVNLSPDHKWIAFSTGGGHFAQNKLWLMGFELPHP